VRAPQVVLQPDGIHVHVVSRLDEPAQLIGLRRDVEPGETDYVSTSPPGRVGVSCYPYSQHESPEEPARMPLEVLDPEGIYVDGDIECTGTSWSSTADFAELPLEVGPVPLDVARATIEGLGPDDEVLYAGYPEHAQRAVIVRRGGAVVATFSFVTLDGDKWSVAGSQGCSSSGIAWG
jgi:hypothetical protein